LKSYLTPIWTTVTGLSFALQGTVTEFISACQFVFFKQPYDVGDLVVIEDKELIVDKICLLDTVFHRHSNGTVENIAHRKISDSWITNLTRSKGRSVKEVVTTPENPGVITTPQLEQHRQVLTEFIEDNLTRGRYLDAQGIKLSVEPASDLRQKVIVHIKLNDIVMRDEHVLTRAISQVREKLEDLVRVCNDQRSAMAETLPVQRSATI
jgi:hypothetical protein